MPLHACHCGGARHRSHPHDAGARRRAGYRPPRGPSTPTWRTTPHGATDSSRGA